MMSTSYLHIPLPDTPPTGRKCRACLDPIRGHAGPYGLNKCNNNLAVVTARKALEDRMKERPKRKCKIDAVERIRNMK